MESIYEKRKELSKIFELKARVEEIEERYLRAEALATKTTPSFGGCGGGDSDIIDKWVRACDLETIYDDAVARLEAKKREHECLFANVKNSRHLAVLRARYIDCLPWRTIAEEVLTPPRAVEYVRGELHKKALWDVIKYNEGKK